MTSKEIGETRGLVQWNEEHSRSDESVVGLTGAAHHDLVLGAASESSSVLNRLALVIYALVNENVPMKMASLDGRVGECGAECDAGYQQ